MPFRFNPFSCFLDFFTGSSSSSYYVPTGATDPVSASAGELFFNTVEGGLKIYIDDVWQLVGTATPPPTAPTIFSINGDESSPATAVNPDPDVVVSDVEVGDLVTLYVDGVESSSDTAADVTISIQIIGLAVDTFSITAKITRGGMVSDPSTAFEYTVELPDAPVIYSVAGDTSSPASDTDSTPDVVINSVQADDLVTLYVDGVEDVSDTATGTSITLTASALAEDTFSLTATITRAGLESAASTAFSYTYTAPSGPRPYSHLITVDYTKVTADLVDFPVLLTEANFLTDAFDNSDNGGGDLIFTSDSAGNNRLSCEIVNWDNGATNKAEVWVKTDLSDSANTLIYVWYGEPSATQPDADAAYGSEDVWSNGFQGVWHMQETSGTRYDSTANHNNLTDNNTVTSDTGKVGTGANFSSAATEYLSITDAAQTGLESNYLTLSIWTKFHENGGDNIISKWSNSGKRQYGWSRAGDIMYFMVSSSGDYEGDRIEYSSAGAYPNDVFVYYHITYGVGTGILYKNGSSLNTVTTMPITIVSSDPIFTIGQTADLYSAQTLDGIFDEARVANVVRTPTWISTEYANQNAPDTFAAASAI